MFMTPESYLLCSKKILILGGIASSVCAITSAVILNTMITERKLEMADVEV